MNLQGVLIEQPINGIQYTLQNNNLFCFNDFKFF